MKYRLNNKPISADEVLRLFNGAMIRFINNGIREAEEAGLPLPIFRTNLGPLVVLRENEEVLR